MKKAQIYDPIEIITMIGVILFGYMMLWVFREVISNVAQSAISALISGDYIIAAWIVIGIVPLSFFVYTLGVAYYVYLKVRGLDA